MQVQGCLQRDHPATAVPQYYANWVPCGKIAVQKAEAVQGVNGQWVMTKESSMIAVHIHVF